MLFKKICVAALMGGIVSPLAVHAADKRNVDVMLYASVPDDTFYVIPTSDWRSSERQVFAYNLDTERFSPFNKQLIIMSTAGAVTAKLSYQPLLGGAGGNIPLTVSIDGNAIGMTTAVKVAETDEAKSKKTVNLNITPGDPDSSGYVAGEYEGSVSMLFEVDPS